MYNYDIYLSRLSHVSLGWTKDTFCSTIYEHIHTTHSARSDLYLTTLMPSQIALAAYISTACISAAPNLILLLFPNYSANSNSNSILLSLGQALAAGGLLGDVFLHTLPHSMMDAKDDHDNTIGLLVLFGFLVFLVFDMFVRALGGGHHHHEDCKDKELVKNNNGMSMFNSNVILNLAADALHNFTDGLAIGASFATSSSLHHHHDTTFSMSSIISILRSRGGFASISVMLHEIPHELGDFAILISAGMSKKQAILAQFFTALAAFCGTGVGLMAMDSIQKQEHQELGNALLSFTAGGFVYISACCIIPELLEDSSKKGSAMFSRRLLQICAFCAGVAIMYYVALWEHEEDHGHGHGHHHHEHAPHHEVS